MRLIRVLNGYGMGMLFYNPSEVLTLTHVRSFSLSFCFHLAFDSLPVTRFERLMPRSWVGFGRSIVRGRSVSSHPCVQISVASCLYPPPYPSSFPATRCVAPEVSVSMYCRGMQSHLH
jgi:hypothetical protein